MRSILTLFTTAALVLAFGGATAQPLSGAIFTTTVDGAIVNENVRYQKKEDVYLDGGPGPNAPSTAAGLPEGDYFFQVTDPSGKDLLSSDHISCRKIHVNANGVIDEVYSGMNYEWRGGWDEVPCQHNEGIDQDHYELGAITVQLFPYDDTPNPGGVYKAWITPVEDYACETSAPQAKSDPVNNEGCSQFHGFVPAASKTDNYKVKKRKFVPPEIRIEKYHDKNANGVSDEGEEEITGWAVDVTDPLGTTNTVYTPETVLAATPGIYSADEETPAGTRHTFSYLDGEYLTGPPNPVTVYVLGQDGETHLIQFGNVGLGSIKACKIFDKDTDGVADEGEPPIPGWMFELYAGTGTGKVLYASGTAGNDGCVTFDGLPPGDYTVVELVADGYIASGPTSSEITIVSTLDSTNGPVLTGSSETATFTNYCEPPPADFGTKGYWHNKNGLQELDESDRDYVNGLDPYDDPTTYFGNGDEPFDGYFDDGTAVAAAFNSSDGSVIWDSGTWQSEVSQFLVDANAGGDPSEQLAQQLLAFIFNVRNRLEGGALAAIKLPDGSYIVAGDLIAQAITVWQTGSDAQKVTRQELLNGFNESDSVHYIPGSPCSVNYSQ
jgi:hypothetical protein